MRKVAAPIFFFVCCAAFGFYVLKQSTRYVNQEHAQKNVLAMLEKPPMASNIEATLFVKAAAKIEPAVVNIDTSGTKETGTDFLGRPVGYSFVGKGSGVLISPDGYIVTNNHVIDDARIIRISMTDGQTYDARVVGADPQTDLAVIKIDGTKLPFAEFGDSDALRVGEYVIAIGNPLGVGTTVTHGIVSATDRKNLPVGDGRIIAQAIQTDAPINKGNSGGALANVNGQLIGINTAIKTDGGGSLGIGFAIPTNFVRNILKTLITQGKNTADSKGQPYLGVVAIPLDDRQAAFLGIPPGMGVTIDVFALSPADSAGLKRGTVVVAIDSVNISKTEDIRNVVRKHKPGDTVILTVVHGDGSKAKVPVKVGRRPEGLK